MALGSKCTTNFANECVEGLVSSRSLRLPSSTVRVSRRPSRVARGATTGEKKLVGRKRHTVVDTLGLVWAIVITAASVQDRDGGKLALTAFRDAVKYPKIIWADAAYQSLVSWGQVLWLWTIEIVKRPQGRFEVQPHRWIVERTFGWLNRSRRLSKSYERTIESDKAFVQVAMIHLMLKRLC